MNKFKERVLRHQGELDSLYNREIEKFGGITIWETRTKKRRESNPPKKSAEEVSEPISK